MNEYYVCFNINGIRARLHQLAAVIETYQPLVIGLQETKVHDEQFPQAQVSELGYQSFYHGQKAHYGVALLVRDQAIQDGSNLSVAAVQKGFPTDDSEAQRRFIGIELKHASGQSLWVYNGYFPQGEGRDHPVKFPAKEAFYADLGTFIQSKHQPQDALMLMGDMNVAPADLDVGLSEQNAKRWLRSGKSSFLPEEREWHQRLLATGLFDTWRRKYPQDPRLSWFDYRSRGFEQDPKHGLRIDQILLSDGLSERFIDAGIDHEIRAMEKPSDHCPIWVSLNGGI